MELIELKIKISGASGIDCMYRSRNVQIGAELSRAELSRSRVVPEPSCPEPSCPEPSCPEPSCPCPE